MEIRIDYDRTELAIGDVVTARATVTNRQDAEAPMVMLDLPVPPGFIAESAGFDRLVQDGRIARYQVRPRTVLVYLRAGSPGRPLVLEYRLRATLPVRAAARQRGCTSITTRKSRALRRHRGSWWWKSNPTTRSATHPPQPEA
ncbi:MAG: hypothetical protein U0736_26470 [Gemmataceae bacterium]